MAFRLPSPWQQLVDPVDVMIGDAGQDVGEIGFGIVAVEPGGLGDGVESYARIWWMRAEAAYPR